MLDAKNKNAETILKSMGSSDFDLTNNPWIDEIIYSEEQPEPELEGNEVETPLLNEGLEEKESLDSDVSDLKTEIRLDSNFNSSYDIEDNFSQDDQEDIILQTEQNQKPINLNQDLDENNNQIENEIEDLIENQDDQEDIILQTKQNQEPINLNQDLDENNNQIENEIEDLIENQDDQKDIILQTEQNQKPINLNQDLDENDDEIENEIEDLLENQDNQEDIILQTEQNQKPINLNQDLDENDDEIENEIEDLLENQDNQENIILQTEQNQEPINLNQDLDENDDEIENGIKNLIENQDDQKDIILQTEQNQKPINLNQDLDENDDEIENEIEDLLENQDNQEDLILQTEQKSSMTADDFFSEESLTPIALSDDELNNILKNVDEKGEQDAANFEIPPAPSEENLNKSIEPSEDQLDKILDQNDGKKTDPSKETFEKRSEEELKEMRSTETAEEFFSEEDNNPITLSDTELKNILEDVLKEEDKLQSDITFENTEDLDTSLDLNSEDFLTPYEENNYPTEKEQTIENNYPTEEEQTIENNYPTEEEQTIENNYPTEKEQTIENNYPTEKEQTIENNYPTEKISQQEKTDLDYQAPQITNDEAQLNIDSEYKEKNLDREEVRDVVAYLDNLLGELPDETIEKFARSEYFKLYQKVMEQLDL